MSQKHALLLGGREPPVHFFDHLAAGRSHDEPHAVAGARERANRRRREIAGDVERMPLTQDPRTSP